MQNPKSCVICLVFFFSLNPTCLLIKTLVYYCKERAYTNTYTCTIVFLITMSCWIPNSEASEQPHHCSSQSNTLLTHVTCTRPLVCIRPGLVSWASTLQSEFIPSVWHNQKLLLMLGEGGFQSAESRTEGHEDTTEVKGRKQKIKTSRASVHMKNKPVRWHIEQHT